MVSGGSGGVRGSWDWFKWYDPNDLTIDAESKEKIEIAPGRYHTGKVGDLLHPERESLATLLATKAAVESAAFSARRNRRLLVLRRSPTQAAISSLRVCSSGIRRSRHWDDRTARIDSPDLGDFETR